MSVPEIKCIVGVHGAPRSGTSWLGQLFNSSEHVAYRYQPMFSHAFKNRLNFTSTESDISNFFSDLLSTEDDFVLQRGSSSLSGYEIAFPKKDFTHLVYKEVRYHQLIAHLLRLEPTYCAIGLIRNPCAVLHSWTKAPREYDPTWHLVDEWRRAPRKNEGHPENWYGFERWKELALLFHRLKEQYPNRFHIIRYENLVAAPQRTLRMLYDVSGLPWTTQTREFLLRTRTRNDGSPYGVFRESLGGEDPWRGSLDKNIVAAIESELSDGALNEYLQPSLLKS